MPAPRRRRPAPAPARAETYFRRFIAVMVVLALVGMGWLGWLWWRTEETDMVRYPEFGIPIPIQYSIHGIDVSRYQQRISWEAVRGMEIDGIRPGFAFIKATEGVQSVDPLFERNWKRSREAGVVRGAYHFFVPTRSGRAQAEHFIRTVDLRSGDLPPVLDIESTGGQKPEALRRELKAWLNIVEEHYNVRPILYTYVHFYEKHLAGDFDEYPLWVAHYLQPAQPRIGRPWSFWQHSEAGHVNGIVSRVDFNVFNGDSLAFRGLLVP